MSDDTEQDRAEGKVTKPQWLQWVEVYFPALLLIVFFGLLFYMAVSVVKMDMRMGRPRVVTEAQALIDANERLMQLTQWTVGTVLVISGGLIGLNWYQSQRRHEQAREELKELSTRHTREFEERTTRLEEANDERMAAFEEGNQERMAALGEGLVELGKRLQRIEDRDTDDLQDLLVELVMDVELAEGPLETYSALSLGYWTLLDEEAPDRTLSTLFIDQLLPLLKAEIDYTKEDVVLRNDDARQRYLEFLDEIIDNIPTRAAEAEELKRFVRIEDREAGSNG